MSEKSLEKLLNSSTNGTHRTITRHAREMDELLNLLQSALPEDLAGAIVAANIREQGELVVLARSPAWAARLRFEAAKLLAAARTANESLSSCSVRVVRS